MKKYVPLKKRLNFETGLAFDTETTGLIPYPTLLSKKFQYVPARPFSFGFCDGEGNRAYVRWEVNPFTRAVIVKPNEFEDLNSVFSNHKLSIGGWNIDFDIRMCEYIGFTFKAKIVEALFMTHVVTGGRELTYQLKPISEAYLGIDDSDQKDLLTSVNKGRREGKKLGWNIATEEKGFGGEPNKADYWLGDPVLCKKYNVTDAVRTMMLIQLFKDEIESNPNFKKTYEREIRLFYVLKKAINKGVRVHPGRLADLRHEYGEYANKHLSIIQKKGGKGLNINSPKQMAQKFFIEKKYKPLTFGKELKVKKNGNTGAYFPDKYPYANPQCNGDFLIYVAEKHGDTLAKSILEYKAALHMINSFLDPYERFRTQEEDGTWVLKPGFKQVGTATGRLSCSDPNLMQVASETTGRKKSDLALRPREAFGPRKGYVWYLPDFSQMEVWVFAFQAGGQVMIDALLTGQDFHGFVAKWVWGDRPDFEENKKYYRKRAKLLMFCKLYGGGVNKVAYLTDSSVKEASIFVEEYEAKLPGIKTYMDRTIKRVERDGYLVNPFGRTYFLDRRFSYKGVNYMIQGSCADLMKAAMVNVDNYLSTYWEGANLLLTLHDELVIEVPLEYHSLELMNGIVKTMQKDSKVLGVPVPLPIGMKIVKSKWNRTTEIPQIENEWKERYINGKKTK